MKKERDGFGSIVTIDLTRRKVEISEISRKMAVRDLGGFGFNIRYLYENLKEGTDPLGPENVLVLSLGLLTGTAAPSSSRVHFNALSPLSGLIGSSSVGGSLGSFLRFVGISSMIVRGRAATPVTIDVDDRCVRISDAQHLWGMDTRQTEARIRAGLGDEKTEVLSIGPAGENLVRFACIMAGIDHSAGHTGLGAVMGSKNLKAIAVRGVTQSVRTPPQAREHVREYVRDIRNSVSRFQDYSQLGSSGDLLELNEMGLLGTRNYRSMSLEGADKIDGRNLKSYVIKDITCPRCAVHCKAEVELKGGRHKGFRGSRPEYETVIDLGALCGLTDPDSLMYLSNLCNMLGLDTISTGSVLAFAMDLFDRGIVTQIDTNDIKLTWGNADAMEEMMNMIARRSGFGAILADGVLRASRRPRRGHQPRVEGRGEVCVPCQRCRDLRFGSPGDDGHCSVLRGEHARRRFHQRLPNS